MLRSGGRSRRRIAAVFPSWSLNVFDTLFLARARRGPRPFAIIPDHWRPDILKNNFPVADDAANLETSACRMASGWIYPALLLRSTEVLQFLLERRSGAVPGPSVPATAGTGSCADQPTTPCPRQISRSKSEKRGAARGLRETVREMKITHLETFMTNSGLHNHLFLRLRTDTGLTAVGEASLDWHERAVEV